MQDRVPLYPNRFRISYVDGQENLIDLKREDGATQEGTPLNKKTLFSDETAILFGLEENSFSVTPDSAFRYLYEKMLWKKVVDETFDGELKEITAELPRELMNYSEFLILFSAGDGNPNNPKTIPTDVVLTTNKDRNFTVQPKNDFSVYQSSYNPHCKVDKIDLIKMDGGNLFIPSYRYNSLNNFLDKEEFFNSIVFEASDSSSYFFLNNTNILIFAR